MRDPSRPSNLVTLVAVVGVKPPPAGATLRVGRRRRDRSAHLPVPDRVRRPAETRQGQFLSNAIIHPSCVLIILKGVLVKTGDSRSLQSVSEMREEWW